MSLIVAQRSALRIMAALRKQPPTMRRSQITTPASGEDGHPICLFAGSGAGGRRAASLYTLIETAKLNGLNPQASLTEVPIRIPDHKITRPNLLMPWNYARQRRVWQDGADWTVSNR